MRLDEGAALEEVAEAAPPPRGQTADKLGIEVAEITREIADALPAGDDGRGRGDRRRAGRAGGPARHRPTLRDPRDQPSASGRHGGHGRRSPRRRGRRGGVDAGSVRQRRSEHRERADAQITTAASSGRRRRRSARRRTAAGPDSRRGKPGDMERGVFAQRGTPRSQFHYPSTPLGEPTCVGRSFSPASNGAKVAELVDAQDLGSCGPWPWGFDSPLSHCACARWLRPVVKSVDPARLQVTVTEAERCVRLLRIVVPADLVDAERQSASRKLAGRMKVKGFRKGKGADRVREPAVRRRGAGSSDGQAGPAVGPGGDSVPWTQADFLRQDRRNGVRLRGPV